MRLPHRPKPLPTPEGKKRENKASFITLPPPPSCSPSPPLEHYPFPVLFWCVNERIENLQAPKEMLSMKMRQSGSTRVHTARHSSQPDSNQTHSTLLLSHKHTQDHTHNCTAACWLTSLCRHKHLHGEVKKKLHRPVWESGDLFFQLKWGFSFKCARGNSRRNISAASITSVKWKHADCKIKSLFGSTEDLRVVQCLWISEALLRETHLKVFILFNKLCCYLINSCTSTKILCWDRSSKSPF